jgi:hypothetical protein
MFNENKYVNRKFKKGSDKSVPRAPVNEYVYQNNATVL